jgi:ribosomal protein S27AE
MTSKATDVSEGLESCPFCGAPAHIIEGHRNHFRAQCSKCGANIGEFFANRSIAEDCRRAAQAWNTRATVSPPLPSLEVERLPTEAMVIAVRDAMLETGINIGVSDWPDDMAFAAEKLARAALSALPPLEDRRE